MTFLALAAMSPASAQCPSAVIPTPGQAPAQDAPAPQVALSYDGTVAIVGVPDDDTIGVNSGAAFILERAGDEWVVAATLIPPNIGDGSIAGDRVALSDDGTVALIAGPKNAWIYTSSGGAWSLEAELTVGVGSAPTGAALSGDGNVVAVREKTLTTAWVLRLFWREQGTWSLVYTIPTMPSGEPDLGIGIDFSFDGSTLAVTQDQNASDNAAVRLYALSNSAWTLQTTVGPFFAGAQPSLNSAGDRLFVGNGSKPQPDGSRGEVKVYDRTRRGWAEAATLTASEPIVSLYGKNRFGKTVSCSSDGTRCVVGDLTDSENGIFTGAFYLFDFVGATWSPGVKVTLPGLASGQALGATLSVAGNGATALVGHFSPGWEPGVAAIVCYALDCDDRDGDHVADDIDNCVAFANPEQTDCDGNGIGDVCDLAAGAPDCNANGLLDSCDLDVSTATAYVADDGVMDSSVGFPTSSFVWMNHYVVEAGAEIVTAIDVAWGDLPVGAVGTVAVWSDPNGDGVPDDGTALVTSPALIQHPFSGNVERVPIPPTFIGQAGSSVFIGAAYKNMPGMDDDYPIAADVTSTASSTGWFMYGTNVYDLDLNSTPQPAVLGGGVGPFVLMVRGIVDAAPDCDGDGTLDACQILDDPRLDANGDGRLDACEVFADLNGDGAVNALDVATILGACGSGGPGDLDLDGIVGASDLAIVLAAWTG